MTEKTEIPFFVVVELEDGNSILKCVIRREDEDLEMLEVKSTTSSKVRKLLFTNDLEEAYDFYLDTPEGGSLSLEEEDRKYEQLLDAANKLIETEIK